MSDFKISGFKVQLPQWAFDNLEYQERHELKSALHAIPGASHVSLYEGFVEFDGTLAEAMRVIEAVEAACRKHVVNQPEMGLVAPEAPNAGAELPFLMRDGETFVVVAGDGSSRLGNDWTGVCCDASSVKSLWYIGRSHGERSFTKLQATTLAEANLESAMVRESEAQEPAALARLTPAHFDFLHWFNNTQFFRDDLVKDLVEAGEDELVAIVSASMGAVKSADVVRFVQEYAGNREVLQKFIQSEFDHYCRIAKQPAAAPAVREDALQAEPEMLFGHNKGAIYRYPAVGGVAAGYEWWGTTDPELVGMPEDQDARDRRGARLALCANACRAFPDPAAEIAKLQTQAAQVLPMQAEKVGAKFESMLYATLSDENYAEAAARNRLEADPHICHTHDFCDANQVMMDAFESVLGYEPDIQSEADMAIFDAAWAVGRERLANNAESRTGLSVDGPSV